MATRIKKAFTNIPASVKEAGAFLLSIGDKQRLINKLKKDASAEIEKINAKLAKDVAEVALERDTFFNALFAFSAPRKAELTVDGRSVTCSEGVFGWRWTPPSVSINNGMTDADVISYLKKNNLGDYVRVVETVNREALLKDRPVISFISYTQRDEFYAKPKLKKEEGKAEELSRPVTDTIDK